MADSKLLTYQHHGVHKLATRSGVAVEWVGCAPSALLPRRCDSGSQTSRLDNRPLFTRSLVVPSLADAANGLVFGTLPTHPVLFCAIAASQNGTKGMNSSTWVGVA